MSCSKIDYERERDRKVEEIEDILKNYLPRKEGMQRRWSTALWQAASGFAPC